MMAVRLGARKVTAIERHPMLSGLCHEMLAANGMEGKVAVINDFSTNVVLGQPGIETPADVLVSETFDSWIIEEFFFPSLADLRDRGLLTWDAKIVPSKATLWFQLVETTYSFTQFPAEVSGFNYEPFRRFRPKNQFVENSFDVVTKNVSNAVRAIDFDFNKQKHFHEYFNYKSISIIAATDGVIHGACFWFDMYLDPNDRTILSNKPGE
jgi:predicted RNA methylase